MSRVSTLNRKIQKNPSIRLIQPQHSQVHQTTQRKVLQRRKVFTKPTRMPLNDSYKIVNVHCQLPSSTSMVKREPKLSEYEERNRRIREQRLIIREKYSPKKMTEIYVNPKKDDARSQKSLAEELKAATAAATATATKADIPKFFKTTPATAPAITKVNNPKSTKEEIKPTKKIVPVKEETKIWKKLETPVKEETKLWRQLEIPVKDETKICKKAELSSNEETKTLKKMEIPAKEESKEWKNKETPVKEETKRWKQMKPPLKEVIRPTKKIEDDKSVEEILSEAHRMIWFWLFNGLFPTAHVNNRQTV